MSKHERWDIVTTHIYSGKDQTVRTWANPTRDHIYWWDEILRSVVGTEAGTKARARAWQAGWLRHQRGNQAVEKMVPGFSWWVDDVPHVNVKTLEQLA